MFVVPVPASAVDPLENVAVAPPTSEAVPLPAEGVVVPVEVLLSGGTLLKFHWARVSAEAFKFTAVRRSRLRMVSFIFGL